MRRRNEWSKWITASDINKSSSPHSHATKNDNFNEKDSIKELPLPNKCSAESPTAGEDPTTQSIRNSGQNKDGIHSFDGSQRLAPGNIASAGLANRKHVLSDSDGPNLYDSHNDFSSTFMLDEELEVEQTGRNNHHSTADRYSMFDL